MRTGFIAFRVAGVAAVLVMAPATAAFAGSSVKATVNPAAIAPDGKVEIRAVGCKGRSGVARSDAFAQDAKLSTKGWGDGWLAGAVKLRADVKPGTYDVRVGCDFRDHPGAGRVTVDRHPLKAGGLADPSKPEPRASEGERHEEPDRPDEQDEQDAGRQNTGRQNTDEQDEDEDEQSHEPQPHESPVAPVSAGGGGAAVLAAPVSTVDTDEAGPSARQSVIGLILAAVAAVAVALRSARRRRRTNTD
ncbi:hypothetical protein ACIQ7Q_12610 [Streptomyces sp. NPDC096176]|uniref:hypothetical protein n=1 Tax=Streptomyces sp. NPDC096176 TaxID=3366079 RepID=UPI00381C41D7